MAATQIKNGFNGGSDAQLLVNPDGSINVNTLNPSSGGGSGGGTIMADTVEAGTVDYVYGDVSSVPQNVLTTMASYVAGGPTRMKFVEVSGTNIAQYTVAINGQTVNKKQTFYGYLDNAFQFSKGLALNAGDIVTVQVIHFQSSVGEFSAFILLLKDY